MIDPDKAFSAGLERDALLKCQSCHVPVDDIAGHEGNLKRPIGAEWSQSVHVMDPP